MWPFSNKPASSGSGRFNTRNAPLNHGNDAPLGPELPTLKHSPRIIHVLFHLLSVTPQPLDFWQLQDVTLIRFEKKTGSDIPGRIPFYSILSGGISDVAGVS